MAPKNPNLIIVTKEQKEAIRHDVGLISEEEIQKRVHEVMEWYDTQLHLPRIKLDPVIVERFLISRKGSVSQTKERIDSMFSIRNIIPELSSPRDIQHSDIKKVFRAVLLAPVSKLNHDNSRVYFSRYTKDVDNYNVADTAKLLFMTMDYRLRYDYASGDRVVVDMKNKTWTHIRKELTLVAIKIDHYMKDSYGVRIKGIHILNASMLINKSLAVFKLLLPKKLMERVLVHNSLEDMYTYIDKDIMPKEYGGKEKSLEILMEDWKEELNHEPNRQFLIRQETLKSDESKRIKKSD